MKISDETEFSTRMLLEKVKEYLDMCGEVERGRLIGAEQCRDEALEDFQEWFVKAVHVAMKEPRGDEE